MKQDIIEMARQVGLCRTQSKFDDWIDAGPSGYELEHFARLVAAKEREASIQIIKETPFSNWFQADVIEAIKARGEQA